MLRRIGLSLSLLASLAIALPLATSTAHNLRFQLIAKSHHVRHSRAWWRHHRALLRRRLALLARRRELMAMRQNGVSTPTVGKPSDNHAMLANPLAFPDGVYRDGALTMPLPQGWSTSAVSNGASNFAIASTNGSVEAHATLAVATPARTSNTQLIGREQRNQLGGFSYSDLRHTVIDKMINAGGWVVNDRQRELGGHRVFQVITQTPATNDGKPEQVWNFYFTEIDGRIYSLTTHTAGSNTEKLAADAELFLSNFHPPEAKRK